MRQDGPETVDWERAPERIGAHVRRARAGGRAAVVGITGPVGAGKSALARLLSACVIATDDYLPDYEHCEVHLRDLPESADLGRLAADLAALRRGATAAVPVWSFHSHSREGYRKVAPPEQGLVVCEGIHALHQTVLPAVDVRVYVEAASAARWSRVEARERAGERGWGVEVAREFFHAVAEPTYSRFAAGYRASADIVVVNTDPWEIR